MVGYYIGQTPETQKKGKAITITEISLSHWNIHICRRKYSITLTFSISSLREAKAWSLESRPCSFLQNPRTGLTSQILECGSLVSYTLAFRNQITNQICVAVPIATCHILGGECTLLFRWCVGCRSRLGSRAVFRADYCLNQIPVQPYRRCCSQCDL